MVKILPTRQEWDEMKPLERMTYISVCVGIIVASASVVNSLFPSQNKLLPSEQVIIDKNKANLQIDKVESMSFLGVEENYLSLSIKNIAMASAKNVKVSLLDSSGEIFTDRDELQKSWMRDNLVIESGGEAVFPVVKISDLIRHMGKTVKFGNIEAFSTTPSSHDISELHRMECLNKGLTACVVETETYPIGVQINYESIFGDKSSLLTSVHVILRKASN